MCITESLCCKQKLTQHCQSTVAVVQPLGGQTQFCLAETLARSVRGDFTTVKKSHLLKTFFLLFFGIEKNFTEI